MPLPRPSAPPPVAKPPFGANPRPPTAPPDAAAPPLPPASPRPPPPIAAPAAPAPPPAAPPPAPAPPPPAAAPPPAAPPPPTAPVPPPGPAASAKGGTNKQAATNVTASLWDMEFFLIRSLSSERIADAVCSCAKMIHAPGYGSRTADRRKRASRCTSRSGGRASGPSATRRRCAKAGPIPNFLRLRAVGPAQLEKAGWTGREEN